MKFNLSNIKTAESRNGYAMSATLSMNNVKICNMVDKGDGSEPNFYVFNNEMFKQWEDAVNSLPEIYIEAVDMDMKIDKCMFIDLLHAAIVNKENFKLLN